MPADAIPIGAVRPGAQNPPEAPLLVVDRLCTHLRTPQGLARVVDEVSFSLARKRVLAVVGESGSGKSMLARSIMGLVPEPPGIRAGGRVLFDGRDLLVLPEHEMRGMRGGLVRVLGNAGDRAGDRMRRGAILIGGNAGECCASRMIAGTIAVFGTIGERAGYGMTRGTLLCATAPDRILPTFNECGTFELGFLTLLFKQWATLGAPFAELSGRSPRVQRLMGDLGAGGKGEILVLR